MHLVCSPLLPPPPQKKLNNLGFSFLLGITIASREIEDNAYADFYLRRWWWGGGGGGQARCILGDVQMKNGQKTKYRY